MKLYIVNVKKNIEAMGDYDITNKVFKVLKGSKISSDIAYSNTFRGAKSVEKNRQGNVKNNVLINDMIFKSSSTAANFVTGRSTNGLDAWKNENGIKLKDLIKNE